MPPPTHNPVPVDEVHHRLTRRAALIFSGPGRLDHQVGLGDAMIAVAVLALGLALTRQVFFVGMIFLVLTPLVLIRAHVLAARRRTQGISMTLQGRVAAFLSSLFRVGITVVTAGLAYTLGLVPGFYLGDSTARLFTGPASTFPPFCGIMSGFMLATLTTALTLVFLAPRLLPVRDGHDG